MGYAFISYSRRDATFVSFLASSFRRRGVHYWLDLENIKPGKIWDNIIHKALDNAAYLIVVLSPESMASDEVGNEWKYAMFKKIPIIPVHLRPCNIHYRLVPLNYIDFEKSYDEALEKLVVAVTSPVPVRVPPNYSEADTETFKALLKDENWHIRFDVVDTLTKMLAGAGVLALLQELLHSVDERPAIQEKIRNSIYTPEELEDHKKYKDKAYFAVRRGDFRLAELYYSKFLESHPLSIFDLKERAYCRNEIGDRHGVVRDCKQVLSLEVKRPSFICAEVLAIMGEFEKCIDEYIGAYNVYIETEAGLWLKQWPIFQENFQSMKRRNYRKVIESTSELIEKGPYTTGGKGLVYRPCLVLRGIAYAKIGEWEKAKKDLYLASTGRW